MAPWVAISSVHDGASAPLTEYVERELTTQGSCNENETIRFNERFHEVLDEIDVLVSIVLYQTYKIIRS